MLKEDLLKEDESSSGLYFSFLVIFVITLSVIFSAFALSKGAVEELSTKTWYVFTSFALSPLAIIAFTLVFTYFKGESIIKTCGWQKTELKYYVIALMAFISVFFGLGNLNTAFVDFLSKKFGYTANAITLPAFSVTNYLLVILTVCILPAIAEEVAMRGILLRGIKTNGVLLKATIGGLLFSLYHMSPMQTPYQFAVGFVFSLIAIKSSSTLPTTVAHFLNNFAIVTIEYFCPTLLASKGGFTTVITVVATACLGMVIALLLIDKNCKEKLEKGSLKNFFLYASFGIFICLAMWLSGFLR